MDRGRRLLGIVLILAPLAPDARGQASSKDPLAIEPPNMIIGMKSGDTNLSQPEISLRGISRFLELRRVSTSGRFRAVGRNGTDPIENDAQYQAVLAGRFKIDGEGKFGIEFGAFTGDRFTGGWNRAAGPSRGRGFFLKQLFLEAKPLAGLFLRSGGLDIAHGESTEITSYDFDGYLMGQRVRYQSSRPLLASLSVTLAHLGDLDSPSVFDRFHRLSDPNYAQVLWTGTVRRARLSADYTSTSGERTWRQAVRFSMPRGFFAQVLQFENYQRAGADSGYGFGIYGEGGISRATLGLGYAAIDRSGLNSDRFPKGSRLYGTLHLPLGGELGLVAFLSREIGASEERALRTRFDLALSYDFLTKFAGGEPVPQRR